MICYNCQSEIEDGAMECPICKKPQTMIDLFGDLVYIQDYLEPLEKQSNSDIVEDKEEE